MRNSKCYYSVIILFFISNLFCKAEMISLSNSAIAVFQIESDYLSITQKKMFTEVIETAFLECYKKQNNKLIGYNDISKLLNIRELELNSILIPSERLKIGVSISADYIVTSSYYTFSRQSIIIKIIKTSSGEIVMAEKIDFDSTETFAMQLKRLLNGSGNTSIQNGSMEYKKDESYVMKKPGISIEEKNTHLLIDTYASGLLLIDDRIIGYIPSGSNQVVVEKMNYGLHSVELIYDYGIPELITINMVNDYKKSGSWITFSYSYAHYKDKNGIYTGQTKNGQKFGYGYLQWPDGTTYEGEFRDDWINGKGNIRYTNGDYIEGIFIDGRLAGGYLNKKDGGKYWAIDSNDRKTITYTIDPNSQPLNTLTYSDKTKKYGTIKYNDNSFFSGEYINGENNGYSYYYKENYFYTYGYFKKGILDKTQKYYSFSGF